MTYWCVRLLYVCACLGGFQRRLSFQLFTYLKLMDQKLSQSSIGNSAHICCDMPVHILHDILQFLQSTSASVGLLNCPLRGRGGTVLIQILCFMPLNEVTSNRSDFCRSCLNNGLLAVAL
jgi:hypothetical protein